MAGEIHNQTIEELGRRLRARETTPTELTRLYLDRLDSVGRRYNAVVTITEERAMRDAERAEAELAAGYDRGPLHGIPYGAKDLLNVAGLPDDLGGGAVQGSVVRRRIARYREAARRRCGTGRQARDGRAGRWDGLQPAERLADRPRHHALERRRAPSWSGGSSSGSGSAVAAGVVGFAIGSETWGSITTPAGFCGVSGLRPTYGRVSRRGAMALSWTMDKLGPMTRSANDCGLVLNAIAGHDPGDPSSSDRRYTYPPAGERTSGFRFGLLSDATANVQDAVRDNFLDSLRVLEEIGTVETVTLPDLPYNEVAGIIIQAELSSAFEELMTSGDVTQLTAPEDRVNGLASLALPANVYIRALRIRRHICVAMDELASRFDALISPTLPTVASPVDQSFESYFSRANRSPLGAAANVAGLPGIAIPNGYGERGLPTSLQFTGRAWDENTILAAARAYQERTDWHTKWPC